MLSQRLYFRYERSCAWGLRLIYRLGPGLTGCTWYRILIL